MYNYELLRIIAMIMIILLHTLSYGGARESYQVNEFGYIVMNLIRGIAYLGVNCFVMISAWFLCEKTFRFKRVFTTWLQTVFYTLLCFIVLILITKQISIKDLTGVLFPITKQTYWFVSCYILLLCLQPIINLIIEKSNEKQLRHYVIILIVIFSIIPTLIPWSREITSSGTDLVWFITIYMFIAYIRKYGDKNLLILKEKHKWLLLIVGIISGVFLDYTGSILIFKINANISIDKLFYYNNSFMYFVASFGLFLIFRKLDCDKFSKFICIPASTTFGIYLLHDNPLIKEYIWKTLSILLPCSHNIVINVGSCFLKVIIIFFFGMIIELIRQVIFNLTKLERLSSWIDSIFNNVCNKI